MRKCEIYGGNVAILIDRIDGMRLKTLLQRAQANPTFRARFDSATNDLLLWLAESLDSLKYGK